MQYKVVKAAITAVLLVIGTGAFGQNVVNVYFRLNKSSIDSTYKPRLDSLARVVLQDTGTRLNITAYTDYLASDSYNQKLSERRAEEVKRYLFTKGVSERRYESVEAKGELKPEKKETDTLGVPEKRRVEITVTRGALGPPEKRSKYAGLKDMKAGDRIVLENIYFLPGRHFIREESIGEMKELLQVMQENPKLKIEIQGHICCQPYISDGLDYDTGEYALSKNRAKYIYEYLIENGIDAKRMQYRGFGRSRPLVEERTQADQDKNRRVEIMIIE